MNYTCTEYYHGLVWVLLVPMGDQAVVPLAQTQFKITLNCVRSCHPRKSQGWWYTRIESESRKSCEIGNTSSTLVMESQPICFKWTMEIFGVYQNIKLRGYFGIWWNLKKRRFTSHLFVTPSGCWAQYFTLLQL